MRIRTKDEQCSSSPNEMGTKHEGLEHGDAVVFRKLVFRDLFLLALIFG